ncbi:hypothetical protein SCAR479_12908 [Seiridium cardinale]|uniref:Uncharacterized protein n=1 Tax=Seiridium cardinale TaxID=138064 RepID=A0ABR2X9I0_9PEZI
MLHVPIVLKHYPTVNPDAPSHAKPIPERLTQIQLARIMVGGAAVEVTVVDAHDKFEEVEEDKAKDVNVATVIDALPATEVMRSEVLLSIGLEVAAAVIVDDDCAMTMAK